MLLNCIILESGEIVKNIKLLDFPLKMLIYGWMHGGMNGGKKDLTAKLIWCVSTNTNSPLKQETLLKPKFCG